LLILQSSKESHLSKARHVTSLGHQGSEELSERHFTGGFVKKSQKPCPKSHDLELQYF